MKKIILSILVTFIAFWHFGCEDQIAAPRQETVPAQIDLQFGFAGNWVRIRLNSEEKFVAGLSQVSLTGPAASFTINLLRGSNIIEANLYSLDNTTSPFKSDSTSFTLGDSEMYYIGLKIAADSLHITVQDSAFLYL